MIVIVLWLFLLMPWVVLQCVNVVFHDHTHMLLFFANGQKVSEYDQEIPQSHNVDQPTAP